MLVLSRKVGESIVIAGDIVVKVVRVDGDVVRLGVCAPSAVPVHRQDDPAFGGNQRHQQVWVIVNREDHIRLHRFQLAPQRPRRGKRFKESPVVIMHRRIQLADFRKQGAVGICCCPRPH